MTPSQITPPYGTPRLRQQIIGGFIIPLAEGLEWFERTYGKRLNPDHSQDLTIPLRLADVIDERRYPYDLELVVPQGASGIEMLLVTQFQNGQFFNVGPPDMEEILQDDLKDRMKAGDREDVARERVFQELGG